jgi:opacity protein-like surface antigen
MAMRGTLPTVSASESTSMNWGGFYGGIHVGAGATNFDLQSAARSEARQALNGTIFMPQASSTGTTTATPADQLIRVERAARNSALLGGFVGYQWQFDDAVIGLEGDYTNLLSNKQGTGAFSTAWTGYTESSTVTSWIRQYGNVSTTLRDYGTLRGRAGWATGRFMPFVTAGIAFGRGDVSVTYNREIQRVDSTTNAVISQGSTNNPARVTNSQIATGLTLGTGLDVLLSQNLFLRAEYQYLRFHSLGGVAITMHTARAGVALKY